MKTGVWYPPFPARRKGKAKRGGYTTLSFSFGDNASEGVLKGTNGAVKTQDDGWQSIAEALKSSGDGGFNPPAAEAANLADAAKELKAGTNGISSDLTEAGAKELLSFRRRATGGDGPTITNPKGSVTFWIAA